MSEIYKKKNSSFCFLLLYVNSIMLTGDFYFLDGFMGVI